ncbi:DUF4124 domain-containing protein [Shewanella sp. AS1]|uniref:DUF4124 domain-containing protein n=1 Tax=Shewanella sp. AS1 TaxID=2907626 RepID=UPI001F19515A|nr:DUF4124 domain-containing protein [Shewanella sp. AS1]MCE9680587.1 DUF4124 domain-containing protein [Shewanella sp. AS1]
MKLKGYCTLLLPLLFSPALLATTIYKWVDEKGVTHYSQQMPTEKQVETLYSEDIEQQKVGYVSPTQAPEQSAGKTEAQQAASALKEQDAAQAKMICDSAMHQLNVLTTHSSLTRKDEKTGEMVKMTEEERQAQIASQQERINLFCDK